MLVADACINCGINPRRERGRECKACAEYRRRTGRQRPEYLIERQVERERLSRPQCEVA